MTAVPVWPSHVRRDDARLSRSAGPGGAALFGSYPQVRDHGLTAPPLPRSRPSIRQLDHVRHRGDALREGSVVSVGLRCVGGVLVVGVVGGWVWGVGGGVMNITWEGGGLVATGVLVGVWGGGVWWVSCPCWRATVLWRCVEGVVVAVGFGRGGWGLRSGGRGLVAGVWVWLVGVVVAVLVVVGMPAGVVERAAAVGGVVARGDGGPAPVSAPVLASPGTRGRPPVMPTRLLKRPVWPVAGSGVVVVPGRGVAGVRVAGSAVSVVAPGGLVGVRRAVGGGVGVGAPARGVMRPVGSRVPVRVRVDVVSPQVAASMGGVGVAFRVREPGGSAAGTVPAGVVGVSVDVSGFVEAFGAGFGSRLRLVRVPACVSAAVAAGRALPAGCAVGAEVFESWMDPVSGRLSADVPVSGVDDTFAVASTVAGVEGSFSASSVNVSGSWVAGGGDGSFAYSVPLPSAAPVVGGAPSVGLSYSSASVDGMTSSDNTQASPEGLGWSLSQAYIEQVFKPCGTTADLCYAGNEFRMVMDGHASPLVRDTTATDEPNGVVTYRLRDDPGWRVELWTVSSGAVYGDHEGQQWRVLTPDGAQYFFGRGFVKNSAGTAVATNSVWTVPVYADNAGEPCYNATWSNSWCRQAWRWNLDLVLDRNLNQQVYFYQTSTNEYLRGGSVRTSYERGGYLIRVEYSARYGPNGSENPTARLVLGYESRCTQRVNDTYAVANSTPCPAYTQANAASWPDVPVDLDCDAGGVGCAKTSPSFFEGAMLRTVSAQRVIGGAWKTSELLELAYQFPSPGSGQELSLWLGRARRTGYAASGATTLPEVLFGGWPLANRVDSAGNSTMTKFRLNSIFDELGGRTWVGYGQPDGETCVVGSLPAWSANTKACYPHWWSPDVGSPGFGVFHKYVVLWVSRDNVTGDPKVAGSSTLSADSKTTYTYDGGGAWAYDRDRLAPVGQKSYSEWRGYATVTATVWSDKDFRAAAASVELAKSRKRFFRGMHGDLLPGGSTRSVSVATLDGSPSYTDYAYLAGNVLDEQVFDLEGAGDPESSGAAHTYTVAHTAQLVPGTADPVDDASQVVESGTSRRQRTVATDGTVGTWVVTTDRVVNTYGQVTQETVGGSAPVVCTAITYAGDAAARARNKVSFPATVTRRSDSCAASSPLLSSATSFYDGSTTAVGAPIGAGDVTRVDTGGAADAAGTSVASWLSTSATYDVYGRVLVATDARGNDTTTAYSADTADPQTVTVTNAAGHVSTVAAEPYRLQPATITDPNADVTTRTYDGLGRAATIVLPGDSAASPSYEFTYTVSATAPSSVVSAVKRPGGVVTTTAFVDSVGQVRQTQTAAPSTPTTVMTVVNTRYDERGLVIGTSQPIAVTGTAGAAMVSPTWTTFNETRTGYDSLARPVTSTFVGLNVTKWTTTTAYYGSRTTTTPPAGGVLTTTAYDAIGRVTARTEGTGTGTTATTGYTYDDANRVLTATDPAGHVTTYRYDLAGRRIATTDPDIGASTTTYDANSNPLTTTRSASGASTTTTYDVLNRATTITGKTSAAATATTLATMTYDSTAISNGLGRLASTTTTQAGAAYTVATIGYTPRGEPAGTTWTFPPIGGKTTPTTYTVTATYTAGTPTTLTYPDTVAGMPAETLTTGYSSVARPTTLTSSVAGTLVAATAYNGDGALRSRTLGTGTTVVAQSYTWATDTGRLATATTTLNGTTIANDSYAFNPAGNLTTVTDTLPATDVRTCHSYDPLNRLTHSWTTTATGCTDTDTTTAAGTAGYNTSWTYSLDGNITSIRRGATTTSYSYTNTAHPHAVTTTTSNTATNTYTYSSDGNQTGRTIAGTASTLTFDPAGLLDTVTTTGTGTTTLVHALDGTRLARITPDGTATLYITGQETDIKNGTPTTTRRYYTYAGHTIGIRTTTPTTNTLTWETTNYQGSADLQITNTTNTTKRSYTDPYGNPRPGNPTLATDRTWLNKTTDPTTNLTNLDHRYYDTTLNRFLTPDPLTDNTTTQTTNPYTYATNNPTNYTDPTGLRSTHEDGAGGGVEVLTQTTDVLHQTQCNARGCYTTPVRPYQLSTVGNATPAHDDDWGNVFEKGLGMAIGAGITVVGCGASFGAGCAIAGGVAAGVTTTIFNHADGVDTQPKELGASVIMGAVFSKIGGIVAEDVAMFFSRIAAKTGSALVDAGKYDYLFGNVASNAHNAARSAQNAQQLARIGVYDNAAGRSLLSSHFNEVVSTDSNIVRTFTNEYGSFQVRDSLFSGPDGFLKFESTWQVTDGGLRLTTVIPMGGG